MQASRDEHMNIGKATQQETVRERLCLPHVSGRRMSWQKHSLGAGDEPPLVAWCLLAVSGSRSWY